MECFMDAFAFCVVVCVGIGIIALFVKIFNKGKSLPHARTEECRGGLPEPDVFTNPAYDNTPGNRYYNKFNNHIRHGMM
jgi:hypothetical protein